MRFTLFNLLLFLGFAVNAQLTIIVDKIPASTPATDHIFIAGNFNQWNPGNQNFKLQKHNDNTYSITFSPQAGKLEFKFTRGTWSTVEGNANGGFVPNRSYTYNGQASTLNLIIQGWEGMSEQQSTASPQVSVLTDSFYMTKLDRYRKIWMYLPKDYSFSNKTYPVLYLHDGQNLFDRKTAFSGEWKIDETLDSLFNAGDAGCIVVGIDNGGTKRLDEMSPWINPQYGGGEGDDYLDFIVQELKPYIDKNYRTKKDESHTAMVGSSMGGLITLYAGLKYPNVFGRLATFSSAFWFAPECYTYADDFDFSASSQKYYLIAGTKEGGNQVGDMNQMKNILLDNQLNPDQIKALAHEGEAHNEAYWSRQFGPAYQWLFQNSQTSEVVTNDISRQIIIKDDSICIEGELKKGDFLSLHTADGRQVFNEPVTPTNRCHSIANLPPSIYIVSLIDNGVQFWHGQYFLH